MTYSEIKSEIEAAPMTYLPGLLVAVVKTLTTKKVLKPGGSARIAQNVEDEVNGEPESVASGSPAATGSADERAILVNAVEWLALEVIRHGDKCTCGSCHAVASCADIIEAKNSKYIANTIRRQLAAKNPPNADSSRRE